MTVDFDNLVINVLRFDRCQNTLGSSRMLIDPLFSQLDIETLEIKNLHGETINCLNNLFYWCRKLKSIIFNNVNLTNAEVASNLFEGCCSLEEIGIVGTKPLLPNAKAIKGLFKHTKLKQVDINEFINASKESPATMYDYMFSGMKDIQYINMDTFYIRPSSMQGRRAVRKNKSMFLETANTVKINLPNDKITRQIVFENLIHSGWTVDIIHNNCTLDNKPIDRYTVLMESAEALDLGGDSK